MLQWQQSLAHMASRRLAGLLAGCMLVGLFGPVGASRQVPDCDPAGNGCPIHFDEAASAALRDPSDAHTWWLTVPVAGSFRLQLTDLAADYRLYAYTPDGTVAGQSNSPGLADEILDVAAPVPGNYTVFVDSPVGETSGTPYLLIAVWTGAVALPLATATRGPIQDPRPPLPTHVAEPTSPPLAEATTAPVDDAVRPAAPTPVLAAPTHEPTPPAGPVRFPTPIQSQATATRGPSVPATCTGQPSLTLARTSIWSEEAIAWEAQGFRPGSTVRVQALADGTQPVSDVRLTPVDSDCTTGPGGEVVVTAEPRARYYILRVTGQRHGTATDLSLIARFSVSTAAR